MGFILIAYNIETSIEIHRVTSTFWKRKFRLSMENFITKIIRSKDDTREVIFIVELSPI